MLHHPNISNRLSIFPDFNDSSVLLPIFIIPLAVQWWSTWYPGAEPGGGGYIAQRMLAAKDEKHATWAVLFFNFAHYALRPWPWILVGLASLIVFPDLVSLQAQYPNLDANLIGNDLAYSAMLGYLPIGLLGIVITSLIAAFMSTISTQLNWGSSYIVNDFYKRFIKPSASEKRLVFVGRLSTVLLMVLAGVLSLYLENAKNVFNLMLMVGAGTGLLFILRWFWNRINPYSEIAAMSISFIIAVAFFIYNKSATENKLAEHWQLVIGVLITTFGWLMVTLLTKPSAQKTLNEFEQKVFTTNGASNQINKFYNFKYKILGFFSGTIGVYSALFGTGYLIYGNTVLASICILLFVLCFLVIFANRKKLF